jgi:hypothetical protein
MQNELQLIQPSLDLAICIDADTCAAELKRCADEADRCAALAQAGAELAIGHAWNAGAICNKAKEILPHGEFLPWLKKCAEKQDRSIVTLNKWMRLANKKLDFYLSNENVRGINDAYKLTGIIPEPEPKSEGEGEGDKDKPPFSLSFRTVYRLPSEWSRDAAKDFLYEFDRLARLAVQLKTEFGL